MAISTIASVMAIICVATLVCSIISIVVPQGKTKKMLTMVLGVFIICSIIIPIKNIATGVSLNITIPNISTLNTASADEVYQNAVLSQTKSVLKSKVKTYLAKENITPKSISLKIKNADNSIYISALSIYILKKDETQVAKIQSIIKENFKVNPKVVVV